MTKILLDNRQLYTDLKPGDRIFKIIHKFIRPDLEKIGFKMSKSQLYLKRTLPDFEQHISFSKNKWNQGNTVVSFDPQFLVTSRTYKKWHKKKYNTDRDSGDIIGGNRAYYVPNWTNEYFKDWWYDLAKDDNYEIIKVLKANIENSGLPYLDTLSNWQTAIAFIKSEGRYYNAPMLYDFSQILNDKKQAAEILDWFDTAKRNRDLNFSETILKDIEIRRTELNNWA